MSDSSTFIVRIADVLARDPLREKLLLVPSYRVGLQWLDRVAARAGGIANVRAVTINRLVLDYADAGLRRRGLRVASRPERVAEVGVALAEIAAESVDKGYFTSLPTDLGLAEAMLATLEDLDTARAGGTTGLSAGVRVPAKSRELSHLVRKVAVSRRRRGVAGFDDIHRAAAAAVAAVGPETLPLLVVPASVLDELNAMQWGFLARWPDSARIRVEEEESGGGCPLDFFAADNVANEAREILRRVLAAGLPLDAVEVVCTDPAAHVPALCAAGLECFGGTPEDLPMTFNAGLPGCYARPARLLSAWLEWLSGNLPPEGLARLLDAGLLDDGWHGSAPGVAATELAARIRFLPLDGRLAEYRRILANSREPALAGAEAWLGEWLGGTVPAGREGGLDLSDAGLVLDAAANLLRETGRHDGKLDAYARRSLLDAVAAWRPHCEWEGFDASACLDAVVSDLRVMGLGPMPGRLHVGDLESGGHSGRERTFIMGLDEARHPGGARQDPVLLDRERAAISSGLSRSGRRRERREKALNRLLARLRGAATLSYARTDRARGRELFPAAVFSRFVQESGDAAAAAALRPEGPDRGLNRRDDWLTLMLARRRNSLTARDLGDLLPHLAAGAVAAENRASPRFTAYDGHVPEAGADWLAAAEALSPTDLERLAACPLEFFFWRLLGIVPPERYRALPGRWLAGNVRGSLLHDLFQDFLNELKRLGQKVDKSLYAEQETLLRRFLDEAIRRERRRTPVHDPLAGKREERELGEACGIFLGAELRRHAEADPLCLEAALGGAKEDDPPWNRIPPVELAFASGTVLRVRGRVDRIDRLRDHGGLVIIDYKTGYSAKYAPDDPFRQGRHLQPLLYTRMLERVLEEAGLPEPVRGFAYFFPMPRDEGRTIFYPRSALDRRGMAIVESLLAMLAAGCFPFTTDPGDVAFSDYAPLYGDADELAARTAVKALADPALAGWAALRELSGEGGDDDAE